MSVVNEKALFQIVRRKLDADRALFILRDELIHYAQVFHLTITVPARKCADQKQAKQILESSFAWKRRVAVEDLIRVINKFRVELAPGNFEDFCEALTEIAEKPPTSLPPIPSTRTRKEPEGVAFYTKLLEGLRDLVRL